MTACDPFLKWAGGKRWLVKSLVDFIPRSFDRYIEPFLGSGAVFFALSPKRSILSDTNQELVTTYIALRDNWAAVVRLLEVHHKCHSRDYYYHVRSQRPTEPFEIAARMIYLNRTCWNALYRVNLRGEFNVPIGTKTAVLTERDDFQTISRVLSETDIWTRDFEETLVLAGEGDVVYVDPPYTVKHGDNGFIKYNERLFSWDDQVRLHKAVSGARDRGASVLVSNASHEAIRDLYGDGFKVQELTRNSVIAGSRAARGRYTEL